MKRVAAMVCCLLLAACGAERYAKGAVLSTLKDPDSAQWRNLNAVASDFVCGEVNAKNSMGGYTGFTPFLVHKDKIFLADDPAEAAQITGCCASMTGFMRHRGERGFTQQALNEACGPLERTWDAIAP